MNSTVWQYSTVHNSACKVIEEQILWGQTVCRVWLPNQVVVVRVPRSALQPLSADLQPEIEAGRIAYVAAAAMVAEVLEGCTSATDGHVLLAPMKSNVIRCRTRSTPCPGPSPATACAIRWPTRWVSAKPSRPVWSWFKKIEEYKDAKKILKVFRLEDFLAGFKNAWQERDYAVIVNLADKIPNNVLEEDPKLLMWYDQAVTRMGGE